MEETRKLQLEFRRLREELGDAKAYVTVHEGLVTSFGFKTAAHDDRCKIVAEKIMRLFERGAVLLGGEDFDGCRKWMTYLWAHCRSCFEPSNRPMVRAEIDNPKISGLHYRFVAPMGSNYTVDHLCDVSDCALDELINAELKRKSPAPAKRKGRPPKDITPQRAEFFDKNGQLPPDEFMEEYLKKYPDDVEATHDICRQASNRMREKK